MTCRIKKYKVTKSMWGVGGADPSARPIHVLQRSGPAAGPAGVKEGLQAAEAFSWGRGRDRDGVMGGSQGSLLWPLRKGV